MTTDMKKYEEFIKVHGGNDVSKILNLNLLIDMMDTNHKNIRKILGGKEITIEFEHDKPIPIPKDVFRKICKSNEYDLFSTRIRVTSNLYENTENLINKYYREEEASDKIKSLKEKWKEYEKKHNYKVVISSDIEKFYMLGEYGVDDISCFGQHKEKSYEKYSIAAYEDSFVCLIYENNEIKARCWGWYDDGYFITKNWYDDKTISSYWKYILAKVLADLVFENIFCMLTTELEFPYAFNNRDGTFIFSKNNKPLPNFVFETKSNSLSSHVWKKTRGIRYYKCYSCNKEMVDANLKRIDDKLSCQTCYKNSKRCRITDLAYQKESIEVIFDDRVSQCHKSAEKYCVKCHYTNKLIYKDHAIKIIVDGNACYSYREHLEKIGKL